jgi:hypothetical protein
MCAACAHSSPSASKTAQEKSRRSLMFGENALRRSTAPISSHKPFKRLANIESCTGFIRAPYRRLKDAARQSHKESYLQKRRAQKPSSKHHQTRINPTFYVGQKIAPPDSESYYRPSSAAYIAAVFRFGPPRWVSTRECAAICYNVQRQNVSVDESAG